MRERTRVQCKRGEPPSASLPDFAASPLEILAHRSGSPEVHDALKYPTPGQPMDIGARRVLEPQFGHTFANVRVHADGQADELAREVKAVAFTFGRDIYFRAGEYNPRSATGMRLLAHEATHTLQQAAGPVSGSQHVGDVMVSDPSGDPFEHAAEAMAVGVSPHRVVYSDWDPGYQNDWASGHGVHSTTVVQRCGDAPCKECSKKKPGACEEELQEEQPARRGKPVVQRVATETEPTEASPQLLRRGATGPAVARLQEMLNASGLIPEPLEVDGIFGPLTQGAVTAFQAAEKLEPDGIVGPRTDAALVAASSGAAAEQPEGVPPGEAPGLEPFAAVPPFAVPETADTTCPPYTAAERERSQNSGGGRLDFGDGGQGLDSALIFDFEPGSATIRPNHQAFVAELVQRFKLGDLTSPIEKVSVLEGFTDCVGFSAGKEASKGINASIREQRAISTKLAFLDAGARGVNVQAEPRAGGAKGGPGGDATDVASRALNRSVRIGLERKPSPPPDFPGPEDTGPGPGLCLNGTQSTRWSLTSHVSGSGEPVVVGGVTATVFTLKDRDSGRRFIAIFTGGSGGASTPVEFQVSIPSATDFETPAPVCPSDFDGRASIVTKFSVSVPVLPGGPGVGKMSGDIILALPTKPAGIDIGSFQVGVGASTGIAGGTFTVFESLPF